MACITCNCDSCECTEPIQIPVGQPGEPGESIPGPAGIPEDGLDGPIGPQGNPGTNLTSHDTGWKVFPYIDEVPANAYGFAPVRGTLAGSGYPRPHIRVVGRIAFVNGLMFLPLSLDGNGGDLMTDYSTGYTVGSLHKRVYEGLDGGYTPGPGGAGPTEAGSITSRTAIMPADLRPDKFHLFDGNKFITRPLSPLTGPSGGLDSGKSINFTAYIGSALLTTDGKLVFSTHTDADDSAASGGPINNSQLHKLITRVEVNDPVGSYDDEEAFSGTWIWNTAFPEKGATGTANAYPVTFNGDLASELGGFLIRLNFSYPIAKTTTDAAIKAAFDAIPGPLVP